MCRKLTCLISFVLVLSLVVDVQAATLTWTDAGPDHLWSTPTNWNTGTVPTSADEAKIGMLPGPIIANEGAVAQRAYVGHGNTTGALTVDGGTLTTTTWILVAQGTGIEGILNMISGTITTGDTLNVGQRGSGTLNMAGGTITIGTMFRIGHEPTATGHVNLDGGIITSKRFQMRNKAGAVGTMDIRAGTLIIDGDKLSLVQGYIDDPNGWITAYGGNGTLQLDYDVTNEGKTTLKATGLVETASNPSPANEATDVARDVVLSWTPGMYADKHDVYLGTNFNDVNDATTTVDPAGVYQGRQDPNHYPISGTLRLELGQTYYWRVDEVNAPPDSTIFTGDVWSFTVERVGYPIASENITATASSVFDTTTGPENTVNGSGLDADDLHSKQPTDMWLSSPTGPQPTWIQYEFDKTYKLHEMWVWNSNRDIEYLVGFGLKDVTTEYSANGTDWVVLAGVPEFARAPGTPGYAHNTTVDLGGAVAKYIRITANDNWGVVAQYGLSEVRFLYIRVLAREPNPDSGATDVGLDVTLGFRAGREAAKHDVYLGTDEQAVMDGTADVTTVTETSHGPLSLDLGQTYYWRVDEVNEAETPTTWQGDIWEFVTQEYFVVEDFEAYDDYEPNRIFDTWTDGWGIPTNGSTVGYPDPIFIQGEHFLETTIVHGGNQSMPFFYDNNLKYSEAELPLSPPQDWARNGVKRLSLWFYGDPANAVEQMYVKVNGSKVEYDGNPADVKQASWKQWAIDLALFGVDLRNVTKLAIGFGDEMNLAPGGAGIVYFEDIRLYPLPEPKANLIGD